MKFSLSLVSLSILLLLIRATPAFAGWTVVGSFQDPVDCGYFFDADHGMIGTGIRLNGNAANIFNTSDGGKTWQQAQTPTTFGSSAVTSIYMQTALIGYASIFSSSQILWKTTDGGNTWNDISPQSGSEATCAYATPAAIVLTLWGSVGGVSVDGGATFVPTFTYGNPNFSSPRDPSNGIDFSDNFHGVVTIGPEAVGNPKNYFTTDGGLNWQNSSYLPESWGVYAVKGTTTFFAAGEGDGSITRSIYRSDNGGATWQDIYDFADPNLQLTGGIAGKSNTLYLQTSIDPTQQNFGQGLYRSDDLGKTWKSVGGPSNSRDTRFVVTGCAGEVVYAFDESGIVQKTTDGGDGTLASLPNTNPAPAISAIPSTRAGDTVLIPISLQQSGVPFNMSITSFHLSLNEDLLSPIGFQKANTLSQSASSITLDTVGLHGATCRITLPTPITESSDFSLPLIYIKAAVTLTDSLETSVIVDSFTVNGIIPSALCSAVSQRFQIQRDCGDSLISLEMRGEHFDSLVSIIPNPAQSGMVQITYRLGADSPVRLEILNESGIQISVPTITDSQPAGLHSTEIQTDGWPSGTYFILLRTARGGSAVQKLVKLR